MQAYCMKCRQKKEMKDPKQVTMKNKLNLFIMLLAVSIISSFYFNSHAQVGIGTTTPDSSAILELKASDKGFLMPRTTTANILNPAKGLIIYDSSQNSEGFYYWDGTQWNAIAGNAASLVPGTGIKMVNDTINAHVDSAIWNAGKIHNYGIASTLPKANQILSFDGNVWYAKNPLSAYLIPDSALVAGTGISIDSNFINALNSSGIWNANKLQGLDISTLAPSDNQILLWNGITSTWEPAGAGNALTAGFGIDIANNTINALNNSNIWNANSLQNIAISSTLPDPNYILGYDGSNWIPMPPKNAAIIPDSALIAGVGIIIDTATKTISALVSNPLWNANKLQNLPVDTTTPKDGQILVWSDSLWKVSEFSGGNWTVNGDNVYRASGNVGIGTANPNGLLHVENPAALSSITFTDAGSGQDDIVIDHASPFSGSSSKTYIVEVTSSTNNPDSFNWSDDNGSTWSQNIALSSSWITLNDGVRISWTNPDGHNDGAAASGDKWQWNASPANPNTLVVKNDNVGIGTDNPHSSALLELSASNKGFLMTRTDTAAISNPAKGLMIYDSSQNSEGYYYWNGAQWRQIGANTSSTSDSFDGSRTVKRSGWSGVSNNIVGKKGTVADFLNDVFFPFIPATISINSSVRYEIGTSNSVTISGSTSVNDETSFSNGELRQIHPSTSTVHTFGSATSYSTTITFTPVKGNTNSLELRFRAYQDVDNSGSPTTISSGIKYCRSVYPFFHGVNADAALTSGGTALYSALTKLVQAQGNKTVSLTGSNGYIYFAYPASYGDLSSILDQNSFEQITAFTKYTANVTSTALSTNWVDEPYIIYRSNVPTSPSGWNYQFKF